MRLKKLKLLNIATYPKAEISFEDLEYPVFVTGKNGAGKTTLFVDAITAALYGKAYGMDSSKPKEVLMRGTNRGIVELEFELENRVYKIKREITKDGSRVAIFLNGKPIITKVNEANEFIIRLLGVGYKTVLNSTMVRQGDVEQLISGDSKTRRDVLLELLKLDFKKHREYIKDRLSKLNSELSALQREKEILTEEVNKEAKYREELKRASSEIPEIKRTLENLKQKKEDLEKDMVLTNQMLGNINQELEKLEAIEKKASEITAKLESIKEEIKKIKDKLSHYPGELLGAVDVLQEKLGRYLEIKGEIDRVKNRVEKLLDAKNNLEELRKLEARLREIGDIEGAIDKLKKEIEEKKDFASKLNSQIEQNRKYLGELKNAGAKCPVCGSELTEEVKESRKKELESQITEAEARLREVNEELDKIKKRLGELDIKNREKQRLLGKKDNIEKLLLKNPYSEDELQNLMKKLEKLKKEREEIEKFFFEKLKTKNTKEISKIIRDINNLIRDKAKLEPLEEMKNRLAEQLNEYKSELDKYKDLKQELYKLKQKVNKLRSEKDEIENQIKAKSRRLGELQKEIEHKNNLLREIEGKKKKLSKIEEDINKINFDIEVYDLLNKKVFSDSALPTKLLEKYLEIINLYSNQYLEEFGLNIRLNMKLKKRGEKWLIDVEAESNGHKRNINTFSGGEKTLMGFALRLAIGKLIAQIYTKRKRPRFLIIDEGFGSLDETKRQLVAEAIARLEESKEYEQIIVISHQEDLKEHPVFRTIITVTKDPTGKSKVSIYSGSAQERFGNIGTKNS